MPIRRAGSGMLWRTVSRNRFSLQQLERPIVQAPMGGGPSTPALAAAVSEAGGLGFLAGGMRSVDDIRRDVAAVREATGKRFGVNLFAPPQPVPDPEAVDAYARRLGGAAGTPQHDDD